jgi:hypothetical protein
MHFRYGVMVLMLFIGFGKAQAYPPAEGFNAAGSDAKAIEVADAVMDAMGGWENWNKTPYVTWRFFGGRLHVWDKWTGNARFEQGDLTVLMNINTKEGKVYRNGVAETQADSVKKYLNNGYRSWVNDSYWLVMPYKLKDSGVTLKYGEGTLMNGRPAHVLTLTFEGVGVTPQNKYEVYVDKETNMVAEWAHYRNADDPEPRFRSPWENWTKHGKVMIADGHGMRGDKPRKHTDIAVFDVLPASVFESAEAVDMMAFPQAK